MRIRVRTFITPQVRHLEQRSTRRAGYSLARLLPGRTQAQCGYVGRVVCSVSERGTFKGEYSCYSELFQTFHEPVDRIWPVDVGVGVAVYLALPDMGIDASSEASR